MAGSAPPYFQAVVAGLPEVFTTAEAHHAVPTLTPGSVAVYLSHLTRAGVLERAGWGRFRKADPAPRKLPVAPRVEPIARTIEGNVSQQARRILVLWSSEDIETYCSDSIMRPFTVVEGHAQTLDIVRQVLGDRCRVLRARPRLWRELEADSSEGTVFLLPSGSLAGTTEGPGGMRRPLRERLLLDLLAWNAVIPDAPLRLVKAPDFDPTKAFEVASANGQTARVASFLAWAGVRIGKANQWFPNHPWLHA